MIILDKVQLGDLVKVNLLLSKDRLTKETIDAINISSECTVSDFKITDGRGIGLVLKLSNGKEEWFFENEVELVDSSGKIIKKENDTKENTTFDFFKNLKYEEELKIKKLVNPINFLTWLIFSLKDII